MTFLVIVESEAKARAVADRAGSQYDTLLLHSAPMKISHNPNADTLHTGEAGLQFVPTEAEREFARTLLTNLHRDICLALDSDTRGESWSWMLHSFLLAATKGQKGIRRIHVSGFAAEELAESFQAEKPVQGALAVALYIRSLFNSCLRSHLNRLLGAMSGPGGLPLHFPVLTVLFLLDEQRAKAAASAAPAKWQIRARLAGPDGGFMVRLQEAYGITDDGFFRDEAAAQKARALCGGQPFVVKNVTGSDFSIEPPQPYRLAELLHDGSTLLGMGPAAVLHVLQKLYGGLEINGKYTGLISSPFALFPFHRLTTLTRIRKEVEADYGHGQLVAREPEGHVILPLLPGVSGEELREVLSGEESRLYELIRSRALASQMPAAGGRNLVVQCAAGNCLFAGQGAVLGEKGFLLAFPHGHVSDLLQECPLQQLAAGVEIGEAQITAEPVPAIAAPNHTFASLFAELADFAVPAEANTIVMLQEMIDRGYLSLDINGFFHLRENGGKVIATLHRAFPAMKGINLSAYFAQTVEEVTSGRKPLDTALKQFDQNFVMHGVPLVRAPLPKAVAIRERKSKNIIKSPDLAAIRPPDQGKSTVPRDERVPVADAGTEPAAADDVRGQEKQTETSFAAAERVTVPEETGPQPLQEREAEAALASEAESMTQAAPVSAAAEKTAAAGAPEETGEQPDADGEPSAVAEAEKNEGPEYPPPDTAVAEQTVTDEQPVKECPVCGRPLLLKSDRFGRFWSCSGFPACRHSEAYEPEQQNLDLICPLCHKESLVVKLTPGGKKLYVCPGAGCEFMAWSRPHPVQCPHCGSPFLVEKKTIAGLMVLRCPKAGCGYYQPLTGAGGVHAAGEEAAPGKRKVLVRRRAGSGKSKKVLVRRKSR